MARGPLSRAKTHQQSQRRRKRMLAISAMAAETAWLEGALLWRDGQIIWQHAAGQTCPETPDFALAQRRLQQIKRYPIAARRVLGDADAWLERRKALLEQAKWLRRLATAQLHELMQEPRSADPSRINELVQLLVAEALCLNTLPTAPSGAVLAYGEAASKPLLALIQEEDAPLAGRALAAQILGAVHKRANKGGEIPKTLRHQQWLRRAYQWGVQAGLADDPVLITLLLVHSDGAALARSYCQAAQSAGALQPGGDSVRRLLAQGNSPGQIIRLIEALALCKPILERISRYRAVLPAQPASLRQARAEELRQERATVRDRLIELIHIYSTNTMDPAMPALIARFSQLMLNLGPVTSVLIDGLLAALDSGLDLPANLQRGWLELLCSRHHILWDSSQLSDKRRSQADQFQEWLRSRQNKYIQPGCTLLGMAQDGALVAEVIALGVHQTLTRVRWSDPELYRLFLKGVRLARAREVDLLLCDIISSFSSVQTAQAVLIPCFNAIARASAPQRSIGMELLRWCYDDSPARSHITIPQLTRYLNHLLAHVADLRNPEALYEIGPAIADLESVVASVAETWLLAALSELQEADRRSPTGAWPSSVRVGWQLGLVLAHGELSCFRRIFRAALAHHFVLDRELRKKAIDILARFPALHQMFAALFPQQPHRCMKLLMQLGLTERFGAGAHAPVMALDQAWSTAQHQPLPAPWNTALAPIPELGAVAAAYLEARRGIGAALELPPGLRRALALADRLAGELAHLERMLANQPDRTDLRARAHNLRAWLADPEGLRATMFTEADERLRQLTAEAQIAALEQRVLDCYRTRLAQVIGPIPAPIDFDDDLINAILLTANIRANRRLLIRLLRAQLAGNLSWREQHPANAAFLQKLHARGVNTEVWLSQMPRAYPCPGVVGGRIRLQLERNPLRILQMGNFFDTCLSFGGLNAFSTVANACELNKRVIYATDGAGHIVGRKLIAINSDWRLVGFHTYTSASNEAINTLIRGMFSSYGAAFAARCGLELGDTGSGIQLFAESWYDDGVVAWDSDQAAPAPASSRAPSRKAPDGSRSALHPPGAL